MTHQEALQRERRDVWRYVQSVASRWSQAVMDGDQSAAVLANILQASYDQLAVLDLELASYAPRRPLTVEHAEQLRAWLDYWGTPEAAPHGALVGVLMGIFQATIGDIVAQSDWRDLPADLPARRVIAEMARRIQWTIPHEEAEHEYL